MAGLTWVLELTDKVSGPGKNISAALKQVDADLRGVRSAAKSLDPVMDRLGNTFITAGSKVSALGKPVHRLESQLLDLDRRGARAAVAGLESIGNAAVATGRQISALQAQVARPLNVRGNIRVGGGGGGGSLVGGNSFKENLLIGSSVASTGLQYARAGIGMAEGFIHTAMSIGEEVLKNAEFKRGVIGQFAGDFGSEKAANDYYQRVHRLSDRSPLDMTDIAPATVTLSKVRGMGPERGLAFTETLSDLIANTTVSPEKFKQLVGLSVRGLTGASIGPRQFSQFIGHIPGFSQDNVVAALARSRGISESAAAAQFGSKNKTTKEEAFYDAMIAFARERNAQFGGSATNYFGERSSTSQISTFHDRMMSVFRDVDTTPFAQALSKVNDALMDGTPLMESFKRTANDVFQNVLEPWIEGYRTNPKKLEDDLERVRKAFDAVGAAASAASSVLAWGVDKLLSIDLKSFVQGSGSAITGLLGAYGTGLAFEGGMDMASLALANTGVGLLPAGALQIIKYVAMATGGYQAYKHGGDVGGDLMWGGARAAQSVFGIDPPASSPGEDWGPQGAPEDVLQHAAGGFTKKDHFAKVHRDEAIIPLNDVPRILGATMEQSGAVGGRQIHIALTVNVSGTGMDAEAVGSHVARLVPLELQSVLERTAIGLTGGM